MPAAVAGATSMSAVTNWLETSPGISSTPPCSPRASSTTGRCPHAASGSTRAPRLASASCSGPMGRRRSGPSPSMRYRPWPSAASAVTKREVVPARRVSSSIGPGRSAPAVPITSTRSASRVYSYVRPQAGHAVDHGLGVVRQPDPRQGAGPSGERGADQRPVGDALGAGHGDHGVRPAPQRLDGARLVGGHGPAVSPAGGRTAGSPWPSARHGTGRPGWPRSAGSARPARPRPSGTPRSRSR